jgi:L-lactate dehydrogenase
VRDSAYHIINYKGSTQFAVGLALVRITGAILRSQNSVLSVSTMVESDFGINDVCLSVPCVVTDKGVARIIESPLSSEELGHMSHSADVLKKAIDSL